MTAVHGTLRRSLAFAYGVVAFLLGLATIGYAVGFVGNVVVPKSIDSGVAHAVGPEPAVNLALIALFGLQHSLMARPAFKTRWTRLVPEPVERSTYVLCASVALAVLMWGWRPMPALVWSVEAPLAQVLRAVSLAGWLLMVAAVFMIDGFGLLGVRQALGYLRGREPAPVAFQTPAAYRYVRHPIMTGFLVAFWVTPRMTAGHLLFAAGMTVVVAVGVRLEERDLVATFGEDYRQYRAAVPPFVPRPGRTAGRDPPGGSDPVEGTDTD